MVLWGIVELAVSAVGMYNITKGMYNMYCDAEEIKGQYRKHQQTTEEYRRAQHLAAIDPLTESQYSRFEGDFMVLNRSCILDPYTKSRNKKHDNLT